MATYISKRYIKYSISVKQVAISECEKLLSLQMNREESSAFGLASNLGSLFARLVLAPFEEAAYTTFSTADGIG